LQKFIYLVVGDELKPHDAQNAQNLL